MVVAGLSAGGSIAAHIAQTRPEVQRAVLIAPAIAPGLLSENNANALVTLAGRLPDIEIPAASSAEAPAIAASSPPGSDEVPKSTPQAAGGGINRPQT